MTDTEQAQTGTSWAQYGLAGAVTKQDTDVHGDARVTLSAAGL